MSTVTNNNNRINDAEATTGWSSDGGSGAGPQNEPDFVYQNTQAVSRKVGTGKGGHLYTGSSTDMSAATDQVLMAKGFWANNSALVAAPSACIRIHTSSGNRHEYNILDDGTQGDITAIPQQNMVVVAIDPNVSALVDLITGTFNPAAVTLWGIQGDFTGTAKSENVAMDAIDLVDPAGCLFLVGADGSLADFNTHDFGTSTNRFGHIAPIVGSDVDFSILGKFVIGRNNVATVSATATYRDTDITWVFARHWADAGFSGIEVDCGNASTDPIFTRVTFKSIGRGDPKVFFDSITEVDDVTEELDITGHPFVSGDAVIYADEGGTAIAGLVDLQEYWVNVIDANTISLHDTKADAHADASRVAITDTANSESHSLTRGPDGRAIILITGTAGTVAFDDCTLNKIASVTGTAALTIDGGFMNQCGPSDLGGGTLTNCTVLKATTNPGEAAIVDGTLANIIDNNFQASEGHAIEIDTAGTYTLDGNIFEGYWLHSGDPGDGAEFETDTDVNDSTDIITTNALHGFSTGDEVWYNDGVGTDTIGLTNGNRYFVRAITTQTLSLHQTKENANSNTNLVDLNATGTGETHALYSGRATIVNTSLGNVIINVAGGVNSPTVRNVGISTTTVNNDTQLTLSPLVTNTEVRVYLTSDTNHDTELNGVENSGTSFAFSRPTGDVLDITIFHKNYKVADINGYTVPATDTTVPVTQREDPSFTNP